ncbi:MAG: hypothetical protein HQM09_10310 [Candidatus Riflebacteria bacterium]|nr:hypothetical protein [Candidatus Riflebacteria bacterium]
MKHSPAIAVPFHRLYPANQASKLIEEAIVIRRRLLECELQICRNRLLEIEQKFGMSRPELIRSLQLGILNIDMSVAEAWYRELDNEIRLYRDLEMINKFKVSTPEKQFCYKLRVRKLFS